MNHIYKCKFNRKSGTYTAVSEIAKGNGKGSVVLQVLSVLMLSFTMAGAQATPVVVGNDWVQAGVSDYGTLGSNGRTPPGILYDPTGTHTFNPKTDYLTPGTPWQIFAVKTAETGLQVNNNEGRQDIKTTVSPTSTSTGSISSATWSGQYGDFYNITNNYSVDKTIKGIAVETELKALKDLSDVKFVTALDPDPDVGYHGVSGTNNGRGTTTTFAPEDWVYSAGAVTGFPIGIYSTSAYRHNTGISSKWSTDPGFYLAGTNDGNGDYTIGLAFYIGQLLSGSSAVLKYGYLMANSIGEIDPTETDKTNIDLKKGFYLGTHLGSTVNPAFEGGTLKLDKAGFYASNFTINHLGGTLDANGNESRFKGVFSDLPGDSAGNLTITDGVGHTGSVIFEGQNTYTGKTIVNNAALSLAGAGGVSSSVGVDLVGSQSIFDVSQVEAQATTIKDLSGVGGSKVQTGRTLLTAGTANNTEYAGAFTGDGGLVKVGTGTLTLSGDSSGFKGRNTIQAGDLSVNGVFSGVGLNIKDTATLSGIGSVGGIVTAERGAVISPAGGQLGALTLNNDYVGQEGSKLLLQTALGNDNSQTDKLVIAGDTTGSSVVSVENVNGQGSLTNDGIKVIDVGGQSNASFSLDRGYIPVRSYEYRLIKNSLSNPVDGDWYLRSSYRPAVSNYISTLSSNTETGFLSLSDLHQRIGNPYNPDLQNKKVWGRFIGSYIKKSGENQFDYTQRSNGIQFGSDVWSRVSESSKQQAGITAQYINSGIKAYDRQRVNVGLDRYTGDVDGNLYGVGGYYTWADKNTYVDVVGQVNRIENQITDVYQQKNHLNGWQVAASIEAGKSYSLKNNFKLEPQAQLSYVHTNYQKGQDDLSIVNADNVDNIRARLGAQLSKDFSVKGYPVSVYALANLKHDLMGKNTIYLQDKISGNTDRVSEKYGKNSVELGIGIQGQIGKSAYLYGDFRHERFFGNGHQNQFKLGLKVAF